METPKTGSDGGDEEDAEESSESEEFEESRGDEPAEVEGENSPEKPLTPARLVSGQSLKAMLRKLPEPGERRPSRGP